MRLRLGLALLLLIGPLAFAPAPLPRNARRGPSEEINLTNFQGSWRMTKRLTLHPKGKQSPSASSSTHVRVVDDRWSFMTNEKVGNTLVISIDPTKDPVQLNFYRQGGQKGALFGVGIVRLLNYTPYSAVKTGIELTSMERYFLEYRPHPT